MYESQAQQQNGRSLSGAMAGQATQTMAARLESSASTIAYQCDRISAVLSKINGTPRDTPPTTGNVEKIRATAPLNQSLEAIEHLAKRLCDLASGLEQVA